jgi:short-subunit dehydrogenase
VFVNGKGDTMTRPLESQVVVITGASSGIGRETALKFADHGATVVLAARNLEALGSVRSELEMKGARVSIVITDVTQWESVEHLGQEALEQFGRIDTWVNDASVAEYASVEQLTPDEIVQVIQTNLIGVIYGSKVAATIMKRQGGGGTIINIASVLAEVSVPLLSTYCAAKHGVKGFDDSLRLELKHEQSGVNVTTIYPASMNTPFFEHARSKLGEMPRPIFPVYEPEVVAQAVVDSARHPKRDVYAGDAGILLSWMSKISPALTDFYMLQNDRMYKQQKSGQPDDNVDNLFEPSRGVGASHARWNKGAMSVAPFTQIFEEHPNVKRAAVATMVGIAFGLARAGFSNSK